MNWAGLLSTPWVGVAGTLFGLLSIVLSLVFYLRSRRVAKPCYAVSSTRWFDNKDVPHEDLQLQFRGRTIPRFTITHIAFWNAGSGTILPGDFAPSSPLGLAISDDIEVFDVRIIATTTPDIHASLCSTMPLSRGRKEDTAIQFEYLDHGDGFVIQVIHDGSSPRCIGIKGKIPGIVALTRGNSSGIMGRSFDRSGRQVVPFQYMHPLFRYVFIPATCFALGAVGFFCVYSAIFRVFHWYFIPAAFLLIYLVVPFIFWVDVVPPRTLCDAVHQTAK